MPHLYLLAIHIIFVVAWFAGLFYIVRLFIYHTEANKKPEPDRTILITHFKKAERNLLNIITWPAMIGTYIFGFWYAYELFGFSFPGWLLLKLAFVLGLTLYFFQCNIIYRNLKNDIFKTSSFKLRLWNEVATLFLVIIVFIVVYKGSGDWLWGVVGFILFALLLFVAINLYRKMRAKKGE
jgi:putative membrane protein